MHVRVGLWKKLSDEELMLLNCGVGEDSWESLGLQDPTSPFWRKSVWVFFGRTDAKAETPIFWPPHVKSWLIGKDPDAGRDWGQEERGWQRMRWMDGITDSMDKFGWTPRVGDRQGGLACCNSWGRKELDTTEQLNWTVPYSMFSLVIYCMHSINDVYVSIPISQFLPITFLLISICFFSAFVSRFLFCKQDHLYHFTIILSYIHINMQYLFSFFWLHCVW